MELVAFTHQERLPKILDCSFNSSILKLQSKQEELSKEEEDNYEFSNPDPEVEQQSFIVPSQNFDSIPREINTTVNTSSTLCSTPQNTVEKFKEPIDRDASQIQYLLNRLPQLEQSFNLHHKIGEGTFSSVFLGTLKAAQDDKHRRQFAIKHLVPTTLPSRTERELRCLQDIGGFDNVVGVDLCLRQGDCIVFVMPYLPHKKFSDYVLDMGASETRDYMSNLLLALRRVHSFGIIHRDIKPSNFLYDRDNSRFLLVDFGLAQSVVNQTSKQPTPQLMEKAKKRKRDDEESRTPDSCENRCKRSALQPRPNEYNIPPVGFDQPVKGGSTTALKSTQTLGTENMRQPLGTENMRPPNRPRTPGRKNLFSPRTVKSPFKASANENIIKKKLFVMEAENAEGTIESALAEKSVGSFIGNSPILTKQKCYEINSPNIAKHKLSGIYNTTNLARKKLGGIRSSTNLPKQKLAEITNTTYYNHSKQPLSQVMSTPVNMSKQKLGQLTSTPNMAKPKFQTLAPERSSVLSSGSSLVRVQNSQVKCLQPLSPMESELQKRSLTFPRPPPQASQCACHGRPHVCTVCMVRRAHAAPRAGTPGFRPPEVLLKYPLQTTAVDMWACGVILLCILSGCYPFFRSPDDVTALAEIMTVFGSERIKQTASRLGRIVQCSQHRSSLDLRKLCCRLREHRERPSTVASPVGPICHLCQQRTDPFDGCLCLKSDSCYSGGQYPDSAYALLERLLDLNADTRITAAEALQHPFITGGEVGQL